MQQQAPEAAFTAAGRAVRPMWMAQAVEGLNAVGCWMSPLHFSPLQVTYGSVQVRPPKRGGTTVHAQAAPGRAPPSWCAGSMLWRDIQCASCHRVALSLHAACGKYHNRSLWIRWIREVDPLSMGSNIIVLSTISPLAGSARDIPIPFTGPWTAQRPTGWAHEAPWTNWASRWTRSSSRASKP